MFFMLDSAFSRTFWCLIAVRGQVTVNRGPSKRTSLSFALFRWISFFLPPSPPHTFFFLFRMLKGKKREKMLFLFSCSSVNVNILGWMPAIMGLVGCSPARNSQLGSGNEMKEQRICFESSPKLLLWRFQRFIWFKLQYSGFVRKTNVFFREHYHLYFQSAIYIYPNIYWRLSIIVLLSIVILLIVDLQWLTVDRHVDVTISH